MVIVPNVSVNVQPTVMRVCIWQGCVYATTLMTPETTTTQISFSRLKFRWHNYRESPLGNPSKVSITQDLTQDSELLLVYHEGNW